MDEDHGPSQVVPETTPRKTIGDRLRGIKHTFTTRDGLIGDYDYAFLFRPNLPFMKKPTQASPFFGLNDKMPFVLATLLGFQHALAMLAGMFPDLNHHCLGERSISFPCLAISSSTS
jgi:uric acid-xanthine permease